MLSMRLLVAIQPVVFGEDRLSNFTITKQLQQSQKQCSQAYRITAASRFRCTPLPGILRRGLKSTNQRILVNVSVHYTYQSSSKKFMMRDIKGMEYTLIYPGHNRSDG